ncbi:MAG TPA: aminomethyl-transferring glycine dehydrogenase subunit GcvPA [Firmicutes bacterium]|nr:aminomethyl-transferring glycine dehydrogenase subunit GcvPA [Bacillota bacterium]
MNFLPNTDRDRAEMCRTCGVGSVEELFAPLPAEVRLRRPLDLPEPLSEMELAAHLQALARRNAGTGEILSFLGAGAYEHYLPAAVGRLAGRAEFYTAYTPYQPEVSQGTLEAIYEYQSYVAALTGLDVANASLYDGATAVAEAAAMALNQTRRTEFLIGENVHPEYRAVLRTYARQWGATVREVEAPDGVLDPGRVAAEVSAETAAVIVQNPNFFGLVEAGEDLGAAAHAQGALYIVVANPVSLGLLEAPGAYGADLCVGEGQPLGNPLGFGGPYVGFMAARENLVRRMPGRIVGATVDRDGRRGFVLTLQTREQHIRREKATSNICSNEALCALAFTIHLSLLGPEGLRELAELCLQKAHYAAERLGALPGFGLVFAGPFFHEFVVRTPGPAEKLVERLAGRGILPGLPLGRFYPEFANALLVCVTETKSRADLDRLAEALAEEAKRA